MIMDNRPIGLLDSGVGGLTVVKKVLEKMPHESTIFIGDNAHIPYGDKSKEEIIALTSKSVQFLLSQNVKLIIFACNTATAVAMETIQPEITPRIIGVVQAGSQAALTKTQNKKIAVVATAMTIAQHAYQKELGKLDPETQVTEIAAPELAPMIEKNVASAVKLAAVKKTLRPLANSEVDTLILGCTHYPIIQQEFRQALPANVQIVDPADQVAESAVLTLEKAGLNSSKAQHAQHEYYTTGDVLAVNQLGRIVLDDPDFSAYQL